METAYGCTATASAYIDPAVPVVADYTWFPNPVVISDPNVEFNNGSSPNAVSFSWNFGGLGNSTQASPAFTFPDVLGDAYEVCLTVADANGCIDDHCETIIVNDLVDVFVPNAFTPNGDDINDVATPVIAVERVEDYEFLIFDRWGELIFTSTTLGEGWDGTVGGESAETEVYVWKLFFRDPFKPGIQETVGHITLLK